MDKQKLQRLRQKLLRVLSVLDSTAAIIRSLKLQYQHSHRCTFTEKHEIVLMEFGNHLAHCERHRRNVATLLEEANGIDRLVSERLRNLPNLATLNSA